MATLVVSREEAAEKIEVQISKGEALFAGTPTSEGELDSYADDFQVWSDYNRQLLVSLFDASEIAEEYAEESGGFYTIGADFIERIEYVRRDIRDYLNRLRSIHQRLELFSCLERRVSGAETTSTAGRTGVFLVHGHNNEAKETVARFLERLDLDVTILHEQPNQGRTIIEKFEHYADVAYAVILLTADDVGRTNVDGEELRPRARQNVVLELGYFLGKLGRARVCALMARGVEKPSDLDGVIYVPLDPEGAWRLDLAREIQASGLEVDLNLAR